MKEFMQSPKIGVVNMMSLDTITHGSGLTVESK